MNSALTIMQMVGKILQRTIVVVHPMVRKRICTEQHLLITPEKDVAVKGNLQVVIAEDVLL